MHTSSHSKVDVAAILMQSLSWIFIHVGQRWRNSQAKPRPIKENGKLDEVVGILLPVMCLAFLEAAMILQGIRTIRLPSTGTLRHNLMHII